MTKFTLVGSYDDQEPLFVHAFAHSREQLQKTWAALYPKSTWLVLDGHCQAADGRSANDLASMVSVVCNYEPDPRSTDATLKAYLAWYETPTPAPSAHAG